MLFVFLIYVLFITDNIHSVIDESPEVEYVPDEDGKNNKNIIYK